MLRRLTFRHRIGLLVVVAALGLVSVTAVTLLLGRRSELEVSGIETRYLPLIELDRDVEVLLAKLTRALEGAAASGEASLLEEADRLVESFALRLRAGGGALRDNGADPEVLERELRAYYGLARRISAALAAGEAADAHAASIEEMQRALEVFSSHLDEAAEPDRSRLASAFRAARGAHREAVQIEIAVALAALALMALLSWWLIRRSVASLRAVSMGVQRLARGEFGDEIAVTSDDEFGELAREANRTASRLRDYREHTERLLAETQRQAEALQAAHDTLEQRNATLEEAQRLLEERAREVERANRLKSEFLANMSHELRTPLNAIIGFAQLLHDDEVGGVLPEQRELLADILTSGRHLLRLINDVLDFAKIEAGRMEIQPEPVDLGSLAAEVCDTLRAVAAARSVGIALVVSPAGEMAEADPARIKQVLYNLLSNALKFTARGGAVAMRVGPAPDPAEVRIDVEDSGIGIAAEDLSRLFVEFQQLDPSTEKRYQGTGLGLALSRRFVEAHRGRMEVRSEVGRGSTFSVLLPRTALAGRAG